MKHILLVDDVTTNLKSAGEFLKNQYVLTMAKSGLQALQLLERFKPDMILLDINMPEMDGYETMEAIKSNPSTSEIPVVFFTGDLDRNSEIKGLRMGAMDFIRKPVEPEVMLSRIEKILQMEELKVHLSLNAKRDALTGLWNRAYMEEELNKFFSLPNPYGGFMILDMDNFKAINDNFGHIVGDELLAKFAEVLGNFFSEEDIVCRFGGDEFAVFVKNMDILHSLKDKLPLLMDEIEEKVNSVKGRGHDVSVSIGLANVPEDAIDFKTLYNKADKALYFVKQNGKRGFQFFKEKDNYIFKTNVNTEVLNFEILKSAIEETSYVNGAYQVDNNEFRHIYQFISRYIRRTNQTVQLVLMTVEEFSKHIIVEDKLILSMNRLEQCIVSSLRRGDVATRFTKTQFVILLMDANEENTQLVLSRMLETWEQLNDYAKIKIRTEINRIDDISVSKFD